MARCPRALSRRQFRSARGRACSPCGKGVGGARFRRDQATVELWQSALPRLGQDRHARVHRSGAGQHLPQPTTVDGTGAPMRTQYGPKAPQNRPEGPQDGAWGELFGPNLTDITPRGALTVLIRRSLKLLC